MSLKVFSRAGHFEGVCVCGGGVAQTTALASDLSGFISLKKKKKLDTRSESRAGVVFEVHLLFLLPWHICTAAEESKNREGSAMVAND